jgi:hypothetical protein
MVTKKKQPEKKSFFQEYKKLIVIGFTGAFIAAFGGWTFSMVRSSVAALDDKYDNSILEKVIAKKDEVEKRFDSFLKKMEDGDNVVAQQSIKTFEMYQQKLDIQTKEAQRKSDMNKLEDYRRQKVLVEKELGRDPRNQYLKDQCEYLKRQIQMLEESLYK